MSKALPLLLALLALSTLVPTLVPAHRVQALGSRCYTLYFLNSIEVFNTSYSGVLYLETPQNISFGGGLEQRVYIVVHSSTLTFDNSTHYMRFSLRKGQHFFGYFVAKVMLCGINITRMSELEMNILVNPFSWTRRGNSSLPSDVMKFLKKPPKIVLEKLRPAFEKWFRNLLSYPPTNFSKSVIALYAAEFIKNWIRYSPSPYPRTLKEIIDRRIGDCDDMSRALIALLWSYGIPATMVVGYVVLWNLTYTVPVESTLYVFHNSGPHAFVLAYSPDIGWIPIDFLAGSLTSNLFIFEGYTTQVRVNETQVQQFKNVSREIKAVQIFYVFKPSQFQLVSHNLTQFLKKLYKPYEEKHGLRSAVSKSVARTTTTSTPLSNTVRSTNTSTERMGSVTKSRSSVRTSTRTTGTTSPPKLSPVSRPLEVSKTHTTSSVSEAVPRGAQGVEVVVLVALAMAILFAAVLLYRSAKH